MTNWVHSVASILGLAVCFGALALPLVGGYPLAYLLMAASLLLILAWLLSSPRLDELRDPAGLMMLGAVVVIGVAFAITADAPLDLIYVGNFAMIALFPLLRAALARLAAARTAARVGTLALLGAGLSAVVAVWQVTVGHQPRALGFGSDPIWAAQAAVLLGALSLVSLSILKGWARYLLALGPAFGALAVVLTQSRGPLIALLPLLAVAIVVARNSRIPVLIGGIAAALVIFGIAPLLSPGVPARLTTLSTAAAESISGEVAAEHSIDVRQKLYGAAFDAFSHSPLVGYGWNARLAATYYHLPGGEAALVSQNPEMSGNRHLHADILDFGVGAGLLGVLAYGLILLAPIVGALRSPRDSQRQARILGAVLLSTGTLACGLSYIMLGYEFPTTLYVVIAAILLGLCRDEPSRPEANPPL